MRILVLGGLGNFGARICRALVADPALTVIAAGRSASPVAVRAAFGELPVTAVTLDVQAASFATELKSLAPHIVIHCAGPFQGQGYGVALAACAAGAHYIDLADGREFVCNFSAAVDAAARAAGVLAVSGASSVPGLSSAVVDALRSRFRQLEVIHTVIAPGQKAPRGDATFAAVLGYAGRPVRRLRGGQWGESHGWQDLRRVCVAGLAPRWAAVCDIPDLELFPARYPGVQTVEFRAALELRLQHYALWLLAGLRRFGIPLPLARWAGALNRLSKWLDGFGGDCGGMLVGLQGTMSNGKPGMLAWHLSAPGNHGPEIPCMAAILIARKLAAGTLPQRGAQPCLGLLTLEDFAPEFQRWGMRARVEEG